MAPLLSPTPYCEGRRERLPFNPENVDNMVAAICKISALSEEDRQQMGRRNRQLCLVRNTEEAFLNAYVELINKV